MSERTLTREELYELAWSQPVDKLAKELGLSGRGLGKLCRRLGVPVPPRGYWARARAHRTAERPPLPPVRAGQRLSVTLRPHAQASVPTASSEAIIVADLLLDPHPLVAAAQKALRGGKTDTEGILSPRTAIAHLSVSVSRGALDRALRLFDALLKALEAAGHRPRIEQRDRKSATLIRVGDDEVEIRLAEEVGATERPPTKTQAARQSESPWSLYSPKYDYHPTGRLVFTILNAPYSSGIRQRFGDGKTSRLDRDLQKVYSGILIAAERIRLQRQQREEWHREWEERRRREEAEERERQAEEARLRELREEVDSWSFAGRIRAYVAEFHQRAAVLQVEIAPGSELSEWLAWALQKAEQLDVIARTLEGPENESDADSTDAGGPPV